MTDFYDIDTHHKWLMHDTWVDFDNSENTSHSDVFFCRIKSQVASDKTDSDNLINNLDDLE